MSKRFKTLLIDGNNMAYRAKYSFSLSYKGEDTSVLYGVMRIISTLAEVYRPFSIVVAWDGGTPLYRKECLPSYKEGRQRDTDYLMFLEQIDKLRVDIANFGIVSLWRKGIEADDFLYHASRMLPDGCAIVTTDKDLLQAVSPSASIIRPGSKGKKDEIITFDNFVESTGVELHKYLMYKVLLGDSSDRIPGCQGVGAVTAARLLASAKEATPKEVMAVAKGKVLEKLTKYFQDGYETAIQVADLEEDYTGATYTILHTPYKPFSRKAYFRWCVDYGFNSLIDLGGTPKEFSTLEAPEWNTTEALSPKIWSWYRKCQDIQVETKDQDSNEL